jgi:hypothetical protein
MDATFDYEVWNQPVYSYEYAYFNPQTRKPVRSLAEATVAREAFTKDRFAKYRSASMRAVVGIGLTLSYVAENMPDDDASDKPQNDNLTKVKYTYDLELDADGKILGGEWYKNAHPDFLWTPPPVAPAKSTADGSASGDWSSGVLPDSWCRAAIAAARNGQPLGKIVSALFQLAHARRS